MTRIVCVWLLLSGTLAQAQKPTLSDLAWLAGSWTGTSQGIEMEEHWTAPKGNSMVGLHRDVGKGRTLLFEFLRIEQQGDQIVYLSMPNGRSPATPFPLKEVSGTRVVFENPEARFSAADHLLEGRQRSARPDRRDEERQDRRRRMAMELRGR